MFKVTDTLAERSKPLSFNLCGFSFAEQQERSQNVTIPTT